MESDFFRNPRGFTVIELLVVIAIIGILAGIVSAVAYNTKKTGNDAGIQANLDSARKRAEFYNVEMNGDPSQFCADSELNGILKEASKNSGYPAVCKSNASEWVVGAKLKTNPSEWWCIDSKFYVGKTSKDLSALSTVNLKCN